MKLIICGGRKYRLSFADFGRLDALRDELALEGVSIAEVVSGECGGADKDGSTWAKWRGIHVEPFEVKPEEWRPPHLGGKIDYSAGPRRNARMASYAGPAGGCVAFPGGKGTADMVAKATAAGMRVWDWRDGA